MTDRNTKKDDLCIYKVIITKGRKESLDVWIDTWKKIDKRMKRMYKNKQADAIELEYKGVWQ